MHVSTVTKKDIDCQTIGYPLLMDNLLGNGCGNNSSGSGVNNNNNKSYCGGESDGPAAADATEKVAEKRCNVDIGTQMYGSAPVAVNKV